MTEQQRNRDWSGRYKDGPICDACNKPAGHEYSTDSDACGLTDGPGFIRCSRARCSRKVDGLSVEARRAFYALMRAARTDS